MIGMPGPRGREGGTILDGPRSLSVNVSFSIAAETAADGGNGELVGTFEAPSSGRVCVCGRISATHSNNVEGRWWVEIVGVSGREAQVTHGHTSTPLDSTNFRKHYSGLTPGATYTYRMRVRPSGNNVAVNASTVSDTQQASIWIERSAA